ncbi:MAG: bifunctional diaminohydroxyphosphoribosylaminopyrimidine deaminase/5-amino-6-(5-phosphoribosylamino)uracil reductase RibD [Bacteroidales bacterium]|nr:bifunctional diaminohydroxyphosphoribosylaminopyrimidine deaminase/5-amino-6-(5-phosphoribosylamino)uracil reductase RibD [Bacteroidales bacterium]
MNRCLDLAAQGLGHTAPNPLVGSVVVCNNRIIGEGYHRQIGGPHAEVNAVNSVKDKNLLGKSVLYVNLEPCSHTGRTPPCADMIIRAGIPEVVIGTVDPNPLVSGKGIAMLEQAGVSVVKGVLEKECINLNRRFFGFHMHNRPYVVLKWAQSADGFIDVIRKKNTPAQPTWISNEISRMLVHKWRSEEQSIMVGTRTAELDNPRLNVREWPGKSPIRVVIDRNLSLPKDLHVFDNTNRTLVFNTLRDCNEGLTTFVKIDFSHHMLNQALNYMYNHEIQSVFVEGGRMLIDSFIQEGLWDEARVFKGKILFGGGVGAPVIPFVNPEEIHIREDALMLYRNDNIMTDTKKA